MKNLLLTLFVVAACAVSSFAQGLGAGVSLLGPDTGIQGRYEFDLGLIENIEFAPNFTTFLIDGLNVFSINADAHYDLEASEKFTMYPFIGLNWTRTSVDGQSGSSSSAGLNIGLGVNYNLGRVRLFTEFKSVTTGFGDELLDIGVLFKIL